MKKIIVIFILLCICLNFIQAQVSFKSNGQQFAEGIGREIALGDFNNDKFLDAFIINQDGFVVYFGNGKGQFNQSKQTFSSELGWWGTPATGDINHDGSLDIITGKIVWFNNGSGKFTSNYNFIDIGESERISTVKLADLNGNGHLDLFLIINYNCNRILFNDGTGHFKNSGQKIGDGLIGSGQVADIALGDINNDGSVDAVTTGWRWDGSTECPNHIWINDGKGNFSLSSQILDEGGSHIHNVKLFDLNNDGWLDLIMAIQDENRSGRIFLNDKSGKFIFKCDIESRSGEDVEFTDFNNDGITDILVAQSSPPSRIWLNDGKGNLTDSNIRLGENCYWDTAIGDFNNDSKPDIFAVGFKWENRLNPAPPQVWLNTTQYSFDE